LKYSSAAGKRFYSSGGQRNTLAQVLMYNSVRRSLSVKYNSAAGNRNHVFMYDSVTRSLLKYSSAAHKRFYSSGGQRNTLAQVLMYNSVRRSFKYNSAAGNRNHVLMYDSVTRILLKYSSAAGKRFYSSRDSSGGQRNTLAQVSMCDSV
jgi:hypothetical protein